MYLERNIITFQVARKYGESLKSIFAPSLSSAVALRIYINVYIAERLTWIISILQTFIDFYGKNGYWIYRAEVI